MSPCLPAAPPACTSAAQPAISGAPLPTPTDALGHDLGEAFGGTNLVWYAGAVGGSVALAWSGADESMRDAVQKHLGSQAYGTAASLTGYVVPLGVASGTWLTALALGDRDSAGAGSAALQAFAVTVLADSVLKIGVGRLYPPGDGHTFRPFQSWSWPFPSWPSGHTSSASSVVAALTAYYGADEIWIPLIGYPLVAAIGFGMLSGDEHWTSDLLAGAVLGQCVGWSIGGAFRARVRGDPAPAVSLVPLVGPSIEGVGVAGTW